LRYLSSADQRLNGPGIKRQRFPTDLRTLDTSTKRAGTFSRDILEPCPKALCSDRLLTSDYVQIIVEAGSLRWDHWRGASAGKQPDVKVGQSELMAFASSLLEGLKTRDLKLLPVFAYYGARRGWLDIPERLRQTKKDYSNPTSALIGALDSLSDFWRDAQVVRRGEASELRANVGKPSEEFDRLPALKAVRSAITESSWRCPMSIPTQ